MRISHRISVLSLTVLALGWAMSRSAQAATTTPPSANRTAEIQALQQAYRILSVADHDYKGHRVRAMAAIEAACKVLGSDVRGDGKGGERQDQSDGQLKQAQSLLRSVRQTAVGAKQVQVVRHLDRAIQEITIALSIR